MWMCVPFQKSLNEQFCLLILLLPCKIDENCKNQSCAWVMCCFFWTLWRNPQRVDEKSQDFLIITSDIAVRIGHYCFILIKWFNLECIWCRLYNWKWRQKPKNPLDSRWKSTNSINLKPFHPSDIIPIYVSGITSTNPIEPLANSFSFPNFKPMHFRSLQCSNVTTEMWQLYF